MRFCVECGFGFEPGPVISEGLPNAGLPNAGLPNAGLPNAGLPNAGPAGSLVNAPMNPSPGHAGAPMHPVPTGDRGARGAVPLPDPTTDPRGGANGGAARVATSAARLVAILKDGSDGRLYPLNGDVVDLGRTEGDVVLADDPYLSPRHARLSRRVSGEWVLRDLDSVNGVFARIREPVDLADGDMLLIGQQVLRFETLSDVELPLGPASLCGVLAFGTPEVPRIARLVQYTTEGVGRDVHYLYRDETVIGRENGDIVFTDDPFLSRRHAVIAVDRSVRRFQLRDLGSSNGTAIRFRGERALRDRDQFRVGRHLFRFEGGA
jgi:pSer/pThr/pTyr-binding forkhead associated (FHA) protein